MIVVPVPKPWVDGGELAGKTVILANAAAGMGGLVEVHVLVGSDDEFSAASSFTGDRLTTVVHRYVPEDGQRVPTEAWNAYADALVEACGRAKGSGAKHLPWIIVSGSLPDGVDETAWAPLIPTFKAAGVKVAVDLKGEALMSTVGQGGPDLIRVDGSHAGTLLRKKVLTVDDAVWAAGMLDVGLEGRAVVLTGIFGVVLCDGDGTIHTRVPTGPLDADALTAALTMTLTGGIDADTSLMLAVGAAQR